MPLEAQKHSTSSLYLSNKWRDSQGFVEWKRYFFYKEEDDSYISSKLNSCGLSGRYYYEFSNPDTKTKIINSIKLDKLKDLIPIEWKLKLEQNKSQNVDIPSLKEMCALFFAKHGPSLHTLDSQLPIDLMKYVSNIQKRFYIMNRQKEDLESMDELSLTPFESNLLEDIGINSDSLKEHRKELLDLIYSQHNPEERIKGESLQFNLKKIAKMIYQQSQTTRITNKIKVILPGEPIITLSSESTTPFMLPFQISISSVSQNLPEVKHTYVSYSTEIPKLLLKLFGSSLNPYSLSLLDGHKWWDHKMWLEYLKV